MPNIVNQMAIREMSGVVDGAEGVLVVGVHGLTMQENEGLRVQLASKGVRLRVVRNTLARRAFADRSIAFPEDVFQGPVAVAVGSPEEAIAAAKIVDESPLLKSGKLSFRGGFLDGEVLGPDSAKALASVPDKDTLRAMLLGVVSGPARGLVTCLAGLPSGMARVLQARIDEGGFSGPATEAAPPAESSAPESPSDEPPAPEQSAGEEPSA